jgi:hypothetical protein
LNNQKINSELTTLQKILKVIVVILMILLFLLLSPLILILIIADFINNKKYQNEMYKEFLSPNEGKTLFVYTNRKDNETYINDNLISLLKPDIVLVKLKGKTPDSRYPVKYISHILYKIKEVGFPSVMKIYKGKIYDVSIHKDFYNAKDNNLTGDELNKILDSALHKLELKILTASN